MIARTLLSFVLTRTRLAATELEDQALRLIEILIWLALAFFFLVVSVVFRRGTGGAPVLGFQPRACGRPADGAVRLLRLAPGGSPTCDCGSGPSCSPQRLPNSSATGTRSACPMMRQRLILLAEQRARLVVRAQAERSALTTLLAPADGTALMAVTLLRSAVRVAEEARNHPLFSAIGVVLLVALRPRRAFGWFMKGWSLWRMYRGAQRWWWLFAGRRPDAA
jgi:hypothetical protein